ncbi:ATP-binding protein [Xanthocytophaga agilis]|uniref:histidine kinase n=1 Tax=Xanthocytophaga agilis TaxID=3048010 RepID=A0AAE3R151_9BACT|nr:ATP-binding protein [Xanthocytophaga agilis]MDJ1499525.1 ATP-binding protein [Xanthocytophaga agilis]
MIRFLSYVLPVCILLTGCLSRTIHTPQSHHGTLDLLTWNFASDGTVKLNGEWDFIWLDALSKKNPDTHTFIQVPGSWNNQPVGGQKIKSQGTGIYRLQIRIPPAYKSSVLGLRLPIISTATKITINNAHVFSAGSRTLPEYKPDIVPFVANDTVIKLTIVAYNFYHDKGGLRYPIEIGLISDIEHLRDISIATDFWLLGGILLMACYHLGLFLIRRQSYAALYFSIFCFLIVIRVLVTGEYSIRYFTHISWFALKRIEYLVFYLPFLVFTLFIRTIFPDLFPKKIFLSICVIICICVVIVLVTPTIFFTGFIDYFYPVGALMMIYGLVIVIQAVRIKALGSLFFLIGYIAVFLAYLNDVLYTKGYIATGDLISVGLFVFLLGQALLLLQYYSQAFTALEIANTKLSDQNTIINLQNEELKGLNDELDNFVRRTSHDLRAPIASVRGLIHIAQKETDTTKLQEYFLLQEKTLHKLDRIIHDILDFSKNKRLEIEHEPIDFPKLLQETLENHLFMEHATHIEKITECQVTHVFYSDAKRLEIILNNLISNAIKYHDPAKENPYIKLSVQADDKEALITIADNGLGIAEEHHQKIFDIFYRLGNHPNSTGVGLYIVKDAVAKLGGTITLESKLRAGSTFHIKIPNLAPQY